MTRNRTLQLIGVGFLVAIFAYPLSYGPWCRYAAKHDYRLYHVWFYRPLPWLQVNGPRWLAEPYNTYLSWWER